MYMVRILYIVGNIFCQTFAYNPVYNPVCNLFCIWYRYYILSEIYIDRHFLEDCFYSYSLQIISAVPKESLIPYNLTQRAPDTQDI